MEKGTRNQINNTRRTKKLSSTINEHRNEKTYLKIKTWVLYVVLHKDRYLYTEKIWTFAGGIYISLGCWKETKKEGFWQKDRDKIGK